MDEFEEVDLRAPDLFEAVRSPMVVSAAELAVQELHAQTGCGPWLAVCTLTGEVLASSGAESPRYLPGWEQDKVMGVVVEPDAEPLALVALAHPNERGRDVVSAAARLVARVLGQVIVAERRVAVAAARAGRAELLASTDPLTGLANQRGWWARVREEEARMRRSHAPTAIAVVDLDDLKRVNDTDGHLHGDVLLRLAARALRDAVRESDTVARIGGDEFAVLAVEYEAGTDVLESRLVELLADAGISASVGVAACPPAMTMTEAFERADAAMYERKRTRRAARLS